MMRWRSGMGRSYSESGRTSRKSASVISLARAKFCIIFQSNTTATKPPPPLRNRDANHDPGHIIGNQSAM